MLRVLKFMEIIVVPITVGVSDSRAPKDQIVNGVLVLEIRLTHVAKFMINAVVPQVLVVQVAIKKFYPVLKK